MAIADPRDIPGLVCWYSAEAETAYANGASMTGWTDLSGNGNHATVQGTLAPQWESASGPGGGPAVRLRGSDGATSDATRGYFKVPAAAVSGLTAGEILTYLRSSKATTVASSLWSWGSWADQSYFTFSNGSVYDYFGSTVRKGPFAPGVTIQNQWRRYGVHSAAGDWAARIDGTQIHSTATNTVSFPASGGQQPIIGDSTYPNQIASGSFSSPWRGLMTAVIFYNRKLTSTERSDLDAWLVANPSGGFVSVGTVALSVAETLPALTSSMTLASFFDTDTSNLLDGRNREGTADVVLADTITQLPAGRARAQRVSKVLVYPIPDVVDGRPT